MCSGAVDGGMLDMTLCLLGIDVMFDGRYSKCVKVGIEDKADQ